MGNKKRRGQRIIVMPMLMIELAYVSVCTYVREKLVFARVFFPNGNSHDDKLQKKRTNIIKCTCRSYEKRWEKTNNNIKSYSELISQILIQSIR